MAESMCRTLRDGSLEGEQAPALTIKDTTASPFGFQILDCYSDPLDWKDQHMTSGNFTDVSYEASLSLNCVCKNVKDLDKLYSLILELGKGLVGQGKKYFSVAIDSINEMLRHTSTSTVAGLLSNLRSHEQISTVFWLLHSDLHEVKVQFNLDLSEEERIGRAKVLLPFEHQGVEMVSLFKSTTTEDLFPRAKLRRPLVQLGIHKKLNTGEGEIIYFRDSDDEMPDSDEDPDDDLDI